MNNDLELIEAVKVLEAEV